MILRRATEAERRMLRAVVAMQFDLAVAESMVTDDVMVAISPNTLRLRGLHDSGGRLIASVRPDCYYISLAELGAKIVHRSSKPPRFRVIVKSDANIPCAASLLAPAVKEVDENIRAGDEVIVVSENDELLGYGKARVSGWEAKTLIKGEVVRVKRWLACVRGEGRQN